MAAAVDMAEHTIEYDELVSILPEESVTVWKNEMAEWEKDPSKPNPFKYMVEGNSLFTQKNFL